MRPVDSVKPYENNPRNNEAAIDPVAKSIEQFGFRQPIVVDSDGVIIVGHTRHAAAIKLGLEEVPVHVAEGMSDDEVKAYRIADNKVGELAEWNDEWLKTEMSAIHDIEWGSLGFSNEEIGELLGFEDEAAEGLTDEDHIPDPPPEPITKPGDLWLLGAYWECEDCGTQYQYEEGLKMKECPCG
jgi:ParB-like chromosome segregation protein Spo0J